MNHFRSRRYVRTLAGWLTGAIIVSASLCRAADEQPEPSADQAKSEFDTLIVRGASGADAYAETFDAQVQAWRQLCQSTGRNARVIGEKTALTNDDTLTMNDREQLLEALTNWQSDPHGSAKWLIFIGHGVSNPSGDYFNLEGPDVTADEVAGVLPVGDPLIIVCGFSSSGGWIETLGRSDQARIVITATQSASEQNFARFGKHLAAVVSDGDYDIDHDHQLSWLEAFVAASALTASEYEADGRLVSEHAALEDSGDGQGVRADFFEQLRPTSAPPEGRDLDGDLARRSIVRGEAGVSILTGEAATRRDELEQQLYSLREQKTELDGDEYYRRLLEIAQELAKIYQTAESQTTGR